MIQPLPPAERHHRAAVSVIPLPAARRRWLSWSPGRIPRPVPRRPGTRATCSETLRRLRETVADQLPIAALTPELYEQTMTRWDERAANTWDRRLSALTSFTAYCRRQDRLTTDPGRRPERRKVTPIPGRGRPGIGVERLFTDEPQPAARAVLWRMLYETCARTEETLGLDVPDLDMGVSPRLVTEKGSDRAYVQSAKILTDYR
ncbi:hypothetical protein [Micromonospora sp. CPCC 205561]|uniref:hypothetical protein n=1 Tax=Micromonospora sp. CPCC 205561 TaxID=3122407 RepID=UPI002FF2C288